MRVYPSALRVTSSNQRCVTSWRFGAQFVALNWQRFDFGMMVNEALFFGTGGYVLKPGYVHDVTVKKKWYDLSVLVRLFGTNY
jgi:phosphatidylinositol phospholipase C, delta